MPPNDTPTPSSAAHSTSTSRSSQAGQKRSVLEIPAPIKQLFDSFPLYEYPPSKRPLRSPRNRDRHVLYIFSSPHDAARGLPSLNPACCRWQTYIHFRGVNFDVVPSSNHASPNGSLPFLIPAQQDAKDETITTSELKEWATKQIRDQKQEQQDSRPELAAYHSLISGPLRLAYLAALYLDQRTYDSFTAPQYTHASRSGAVRYALSLPLRKAALAEVLGESNRDGAEDVSSAIDEEALLLDAQDALQALSIKLGDDEYFEESGMLDATVFGYTHVLLTIAEKKYEVGQLADRLCAAVSHLRVNNLWRHRARILERFYPSHRL